MMKNKNLQLLWVLLVAIFFTCFACVRFTSPIRTVDTFTLETVGTLAVHFNMYVPVTELSAVYEYQVFSNEVTLFSYFIDSSDQIIADIWKVPFLSPPPDSRGEVSLRWASNGRGIVCDAGSGETKLPPYRPMKRQSCLFWYDTRNHSNWAESSLTQAELVAFLNSLELAK